MVKKKPIYLAPDWDELQIGQMSPICTSGDSSFETFDPLQPIDEE